MTARPGQASSAEVLASSRDVAPALYGKPYAKLDRGKQRVVEAAVELVADAVQDGYAKAWEALAEIREAAINDARAQGAREAEAQRGVLLQAMWDAREALGFDTDGDDCFHSTDYVAIARQHVRDAQEARREADEAYDEGAREVSDQIKATLRAKGGTWPMTSAASACAIDIVDYLGINAPNTNRSVR